MDLKTLQSLQTDIAGLFVQLGLEYVDPVVEIGETQTVHVELKVKDSPEEVNMGILIGNHGETLAALEYVMALMVNRNRSEWLRVRLDVDGYRKRREDELRELTTKLAEKAQQTKAPVELRPMSSSDRRVVHTVVGQLTGVVSESVGVGRDRHVVIKPA